MNHSSLTIHRFSRQEREIGVTLLFLSALPMLGASLFLWIRIGVASMPLTLFAAASFAVICISVVVDPDMSEMEPLLKW